VKDHSGVKDQEKPGGQEKRPLSTRRWNIIGLALVLVSAVLHYGLLSAGAPIGVRIVVDVIATVAIAVATVNWFRALLKANEEEVRKNPKPW
jgi:hypothetical protein